MFPFARLSENDGWLPRTNALLAFEIEIDESDVIDDVATVPSLAGLEASPADV